MADMIERVARAILAAHDWTENPVSDEDGMQVPPAITGWAALTPDWQECLRGQARAAIEAMREPTDAMVLAGAKYHDDNWRADHAREDTNAEAIWQDMIDAALSPLPVSLEE